MKTERTARRTECSPRDVSSSVAAIQFVQVRSCSGTRVIFTGIELTVKFKAKPKRKILFRIFITFT